VTLAPLQLAYTHLGIGKQGPSLFRALPVSLGELAGGVHGGDVAEHQSLADGGSGTG